MNYSNMFNHKSPIFGTAAFLVKFYQLCFMILRVRESLNFLIITTFYKYTHSNKAHYQSTNMHTYIYVSFHHSLHPLIRTSKLTFNTYHLTIRIYGLLLCKMLSYKIYNNYYRIPTYIHILYNFTFYHIIKI